MKKKVIFNIPKIDAKSKEKERTNACGLSGASA